MSPPVRLPLLLCLAALAAASPPARAARSYDNCTGFIATLPAVISTQGTWCLNADLATSVTSGAAITVAANNVIIDCNDFKLGGLSAGAATTALGISVTTRNNTTIRGCNIRGFATAIRISGGSGHLVEDNRLDGNLSRGMFVASAASTIRRNFVLDTGGSANGGAGVGLVVQGGVNVEDNVIDGVTVGDGGLDAFGILSTMNPRTYVAGNRIANLVAAEEGAAYAVDATASDAVILRDNAIFGAPAGIDFGLYCSSASSASVGNVLVGVELPILDCTSSGDVATD